MHQIPFFFRLCYFVFICQRNRRVIQNSKIFSLKKVVAIREIANCKLQKCKKKVKKIANLVQHQIFVNGDCNKKVVYFSSHKHKTKNKIFILFTKRCFNYTNECNVLLDDYAHTIFTSNFFLMEVDFPIRYFSL